VAVLTFSSGRDSSSVELDSSSARPETVPLANGHPMRAWLMVVWGSWWVIEAGFNVAIEMRVTGAYCNLVNYRDQVQEGEYLQVSEVPGQE
jgi:hypothetical protein